MGVSSEVCVCHLLEETGIKHVKHLSWAANNLLFKLFECRRQTLGRSLQQWLFAAVQLWMHTDVGACVHAGPACTGV